MRSIVGRLLAATVLVAGALIPAGAAANAASSSDAPVKPLLSGVFKQIKNSGTNLCLEPENQSTAVGANLVQMPCVSSGVEGQAQGWQPLYVGNNHYKFVNQLSGLCMRNRATTNGSVVHQWGCATISDEEYNTGATLPAVAKIESRLHWTDSGACLDVPGGLATIGARLQMYKCNGTPAQIWVNGF
ncbi:RICIN domain-containing protein [Kineosporia sp. NBRC 101731]|uniref:RICIN domain-containing protein n=1 Tax=Kineosporia sp. NBRC 101731 TaxID=3032199 RepID=UPI0024A1DB97|nr:RICIN domain-containing protein [Kineosporia sp. NBRC 101731]GLY28756.1 hypothetical protein Kisp02_21210 [Kineosporia sp. NBRC 101731]